jgi:hypothetical protein
MQDIDTISAWEGCGMWQRGSLRAITIVGGVLLAAFLFLPRSSFPRPRDYSPLVELLKIQQKEEAPLYAFNPFEDASGEYDDLLGLRFFNENPSLVRNIRKDLGPGEIEWRLEHSRHRLLFVPEKRERMARLFEDYCAHVIDYTLEQTNLENPYVEIVTLAEEIPELPEKGVAVFLVHNLAEEVMGTYVFSNPNRKSVKIDLSRKTFLGEVGSYTTNIFLREKEEPRITWDRFTIWQTTARNPFTVLCVPVEETLHIAVREHTHRAIQEQLEAHAARDAKERERIVADWMAIEEALVGGVLHALLPRFLKSYVKKLPDSTIEEDIASRREFEQYQHLQRAIDVVRELGHEKAIRIYADHPGKFKELVI